VIAFPPLLRAGHEPDAPSVEGLWNYAAQFSDWIGQRSVQSALDEVMAWQDRLGAAELVEMWRRLVTCHEPFDEGSPGWEWPVGEQWSQLVPIPGQRGGRCTRRFLDRVRERSPMFRQKDRAVASQDFRYLLVTSRVVLCQHSPEPDRVSLEQVEVLLGSKFMQLRLMLGQIVADQRRVLEDNDTQRAAKLSTRIEPETPSVERLFDETVCELYPPAKLRHQSDAMGLRIHLKLRRERHALLDLATPSRRLQPPGVDSLWESFADRLLKEGAPQQQREVLRRRLATDLAFLALLLEQRRESVVESGDERGRLDGLVFGLDQMSGRLDQSQ
jgi:hypothetical protein